jgi:hypothetical protein
MLTQIVNTVCIPVYKVFYFKMFELLLHYMLVRYNEYKVQCRLFFGAK